MQAPTPIEIPVEAPGIDHVRGLWSRAEGGARPLLLACGAGLAMNAPFMAHVAEGLVRRGFSVLRFHYAYRERAISQGKRMLPPDRPEVLESVHRRALEELIALSGEPRPLLAGKSLGARISTILAAKEAPCRGLVLFGYPLHPAGKPERLRSEHFPMICQPTLFLQGTRDKLCTPELLLEERRRFGGGVDIAFIEEADHSFHVPKRTGRTDREVLEQLLDRTAAWEEERFPPL
ncbi:MAG TPA: alpha/beta hydrolase [Planctomycetes bacterium]|nr:alpha/beta hydrolase [Planctomycetota bacterium]